MKRYKAGSKAQPFPRRRPPVTVTPSKAKAFSVNCAESWRLLVVPELGREALSAAYRADSRHPTQWQLWHVSHFLVESPIAIHWIKGVEVVSDRWEPETGWARRKGMRSFYALTPDHIQWLGEMGTECSCFGPETEVLHTFLDPDDEYWQPSWSFRERLENAQTPRHLEDVGRYAERPDGSYKERKGKRYQCAKGLGAGIHRVKVGGQAFRCLRVMEIDPGMPDVLDVAFITRDGRTVLHRRYEEEHFVPDKAYMRNCDTLSEAYPQNDRIVLDGRTFVVWYEVIAAFALGLELK